MLSTLLVQQSTYATRPARSPCELSTITPQAQQLLPACQEAHELYCDAGRHLLTEMIVDNYIPNDTHMTDSEGRVQVGLRWPKLDLQCCSTTAPLLKR